MSDESVFPSPTSIFYSGKGPPTIGGLSPGLTKRELFAAMALQGICANSVDWNELDPLRAAEKAVAYADFLISQLCKEMEAK